MEEEKAFTNRLIYEKSPYLKQHAHNPIDWYPWCKEAFKVAQEQDKPIFLSIGYATCHWCHVMEEESFRDPEVAMLLNDAFVCIKVDREELPDLDSLYMDFAQTMILGAAGWPLNLILTQDLKPFFAATYLPKRSSRGMIGLVELTERMRDMWRNDEERPKLLEQSEKVIEILQTHIHTNGCELPSQDFIPQTAEILYKVADSKWGGIKGAPKFPLGYQALFLINHYQKSKDPRAIFLVEKTLDMMHRGGIWDHIGGGVHRYAVDDEWHIPHFEKMLYDNALLAQAYLYAWKATGRALYRNICDQILSYLIRDMYNKDGGFYSAEDADSQGIEGLFYTWVRQEVVDVLGAEDGEIFCEFYDIYDVGPVDNRSPLRIIQPLEEFAASRHMSKIDFEAKLLVLREKLLEARGNRTRPLRDSKIITAWNGLAIRAFASAGFTFNNDKYMKIATDTAQFIHDVLYKDGKLLRRFCDGEARFLASLDDYAFLISGLLSLFESFGGTKWLAWAIDLAETANALFKAEDGAYYQSSIEEDTLLVRKAQYSDGAEPSGNAVHTENLLRLYQITRNEKYLNNAEDVLRALSKFITSYPLGYCYHLIALERYYDMSKVTVIIAFNEQVEGILEIKDALEHKVSPHHCILFKKFGDTELEKLIPHIRGYTPIDGKTCAYICTESYCKPPVIGVPAIVETLLSI